jgi:hypothetical protein
MTTKSKYLQIRVSPHEKAVVERLARQAGQDVSTYVRSRVLSDEAMRFQTLIDRLGEASTGYRYVLADLNDWLSALTPDQLREPLDGASVSALTPFLQNYVAAMVEQATHRKGVAPPEWTSRVPPLEEPWFAAELASVRLHLLKASPVPFKRRNLFVDSTIGDRV